MPDSIAHVKNERKYQFPRQFPGRGLDLQANQVYHGGMDQNTETRLELEKAARLARELSEAARLEEMKKPHPQQAEIDAASVEMLRGMTK